MAEPDEADDGGVPGLAAKLEHLFATVPKPTGGRYSNESASQALAAAGVGVVLSMAWFITLSLSE